MTNETNIGITAKYIHSHVFNVNDYSLLLVVILIYCSHKSN